jgi:DNA-binding transcriptional LysR family regulator
LRAGTPRQQEDLHGQNCLNFTFRRAELVWPFHRDGEDFAMTVRGNIEAKNGQTLGQFAALGVWIARVDAFSVAHEVSEGRLATLLENFNPGDVEQIHAVLVGGSATPARSRVFADFLVHWCEDVAQIRSLSKMRERTPRAIIT